jgi:hypothetical protein
MRMLAIEPAIVTLVAQSTADKTGARAELEVQLMPRIKGVDHVSVELRWRYSALKGRDVGDVREGHVAPMVTRIGSPVEIPIFTRGPSETRDVSLVIRPEP